MKKKKYISIFCVSTLCISMLFACSSSNHLSSIPVDPTQQERTFLSELVDSVRYVALETTDDILIKRISTIRYTNNCVYILDRPQETLFAFDANTGKCLWKIHNSGQGPGEYTRLTDFDVDEKNKRLYLFCSMEKIQEYDLAGKFIQEFSIRFAGLSFACNGNYMYIYAGNHPNKINNSRLVNYRLLIYNKKDGSLTGHLPFNDNPNLGTTNTYNYGNPFYHYNGGVRFYHPYGYTIYGIQGNAVDSLHSFDFGKYNLPKELSFYSTDELSDGSYAYGLNTCWENQRYLHFNMMKRPGVCDIFYSKQDDVLRVGHFFDDAGGCSPIFVQATDDFVLGYKSTESCFRHVCSAEEYSLLKRITKEITEDDNPVVFFYYFKK